MPWYHMSVDEGPGHCSHWDEYFYSEEVLDEECQEAALEEFYRKEYMDWPIGDINEVTEIPADEKRWLKSGYEHQIKSAQKALNALDLLTEIPKDPKKEN